MFVVLLLLIVLVTLSFRIPVSSSDVRYPVYLDPPTMYLDQHITYDEWPQE